MQIKCADCSCIPEKCQKLTKEQCTFCIKESCCCVGIHRNRASLFFENARKIYPVALGIEILCIISAEIGQNTSLYILGYNSLHAIAISYIIGYLSAGFTTLMTILGRYNQFNVMDGCCSALDCNDNGLFGGVKSTFRSFANGIKLMPVLYKQSNLKKILKTSLYVLVTAESACILTAETVDIVLFRHGLWLSIPLALLIGALTITLIEAYKKQITYTK